MIQQVNIRLLKTTKDKESVTHVEHVIRDLHWVIVLNTHTYKGKINMSKPVTCSADNLHFDHSTQ